MSRFCDLVSLVGARGEAPLCVTNLLNRLVLCASDPGGNETFYRIVEVECYCPDDPYTHGRPDKEAGRSAGGVVCEQLGPPGHWYFHRAGKGGSGDFKGGTFKGLDLTCAPTGQAGGVLVRSLQVISPSGIPGGVLEGPCICVNHILGSCAAASIQDLVSRENYSSSSISPTGCLRLMGHTAPTASVVVSGKRIGLNPSKDPSYRALRARFAPAEHVAGLKKDRSSMLSGLVEAVGLERAMAITKLAPSRFS